MLHELASFVGSILWVVKETVQPTQNLGTNSYRVIPEVEGGYYRKLPLFNSHNFNKNRHTNARVVNLLSTD